MRLRRPGFAVVAAMVLMVFAAALRALVPAGYMPDARGGVFELVICGADGLQTLIVDAEGDPVEQPDGHVDRVAVCGFVGVAGAPAPEHAVNPSAKADWRPASVVVAAVGPPSRVQAPAVPPPARGPPAHMT